MNRLPQPLKLRSKPEKEDLPIAPNKHNRTERKADQVRYGPDNPHPLSTLKTELVWEGKYDEYGNRREVDVAGAAMPMQKIETIDQPHSEATDALKILDRMIGDDAELRDMIRQETVNVHVARLIYEARTQAGLTQQQLADRIGTRQPVIARLEDADYEGHSLTMLQRIAEALNLALDIRFVPKEHASD